MAAKTHRQPRCDCGAGVSDPGIEAPTLREAVDGSPSVPAPDLEL